MNSPQAPASSAAAKPDAVKTRMKMEAKMAQLRALSIIISGEGLAHLQTHSDETQNNVLWLAADLASEIQDLYQEIHVSARA